MWHTFMSLGTLGDILKEIRIPLYGPNNTGMVKYGRISSGKLEIQKDRCKSIWFGFREKSVWYCLCL